MPSLEILSLPRVYFMPERVFLVLFSAELSIFETDFRNFKRQAFFSALDSQCYILFYCGFDAFYILECGLRGAH
jgi:hypothetical protein